MKRANLIFMGFLIWISGYAQEPYEFPEGLRRVNIAGKYGYVDQAGKEVVPAKYDNAGDFSEGMAWVRINGKSGYIDKTGEEVIPIIYDNAGNFSEGLAWVKMNDQYSYIDQTGKMLIPRHLIASYNFVDDFSEGLARVRTRSNKYGFIDKTGNEVIPTKYYQVGNFSEGMAVVANIAYTSESRQRKFGFIDKAGNEIIPAIYDAVGDFSKGLAWVKLTWKFGYINKTGEEVIPIKYHHIEWKPGDSLLKVNLNKKYGYVDITGKERIPPEYDYIEWKSGDTLLKVMSNNKYGYINIMGKVVIPIKYDCIKRAPGHSGAKVWLDGKTGYVDENGKETSPLEYPYKDIQVIWESPLISHINLINQVKMDQLPDKPSFKIDRPYLIIESNNHGCIELNLIKYSENNFNEQSVSDLKTLIVRYDYPALSRLYPDEVTLTTSYNTIIIYFDMTKKEPFGYDFIFAPRLPDDVLPGFTYGKTSIYNTIQIVESRLTKQKQK
ncbi:MAG: WG repeat-containing protein [Bacteroidales bacterium]|jgi:hypothetical protein|nr:WG repeat-containing protein [Bacteroidales bacterium]